MRLLSRIIAWAALACVVLIIAVAVTNDPRPQPAPYVRNANQSLEAPHFRSECRNHQFIVIEIDAHGREREIDEGQFCDIDE